jgi:hypothetical protein
MVYVGKLAVSASPTGRLNETDQFDGREAKKETDKPESNPPGLNAQGLVKVLCVTV